ncbi:Acetyl-coenzyme A synthetase, partial [Aduncisulcus paluster]
MSLTSQACTKIDNLPASFPSDEIPQVSLKMPTLKKYEEWICDDSCPIKFPSAVFRERYVKSWSDQTSYCIEQFGRIITWLKEGPRDKVIDTDIKNRRIRWFSGWYTNFSYCALDKHIENGKGDDIALIWEGNDPSNVKKFTYKRLLEETCRYANLLKKLGVKKGDRVVIYLPSRPEFLIAMLAIARLGAIFVSVFSPMSSDALQTRIHESGGSVLLTCDESISGLTHDPLKKKANEALKNCPNIRHTIVHHFTGIDYESHPTDVCFEDEIISMDSTCDYTLVEANDPFFIIYSSGSTGKPKGFVHSILYAGWGSMAPDFVVNCSDDVKDVIYCNGSPSWIGGMCYSVTGPLMLGVTTVLYEGNLFYPSPSRVFDIIDRHKVTVLMTQPTFFRIVRAMGSKYITRHSLRSLHTLYTAGEPCNDELWKYIYRTVCKHSDSHPATAELIHIYGAS